MLYEIGHSGLANLDESIFNTYQPSSDRGYPWVLVGDSMHYEPTDTAVSCGPGAFVTDAESERGYNAWYGAPGYYQDSPGVNRDIPDQFIALGLYAPKVYGMVGSGGNPWDHIYGTFGSYGTDYGLGVRDWGSQSGEYSLS